MVENLLFKVLTRAYYRQNTGFFLVLVLGGFGLLRGEDHKALADLAMRSFPFMALFFMAFWLLYTAKVLQFVLKSFADPQQEFLYLLRLLPDKEQFWQLLLVQWGLLQPILAYGLFVAYRGILLEAWTMLFFLVLFFLAIGIVPVFWYIQALAHPNQKQNRTSIASFLNLRITKPEPLFFFFHLLEEQKMLLFLSKLLSCFFVTGVCILFSTDEYDHRLISIGLLLAGLTHTAISPAHHAFEHRFLLFTRNHPIAWPERFVRTSLPWMLLLVPELVLLFRHIPEETGLGYLPGAVVFLVGIVLFSHHYRYFNPSDPDASGKVFATGFFLMLLLIMFRVPVVLPGLLLVALSAYLFYKYQPVVEYGIDED